MGRIPFIHLFFALFLVLSSFAMADRTRWIETNSWSGKGMKTTDKFLVGGKKWKVIARREGEESRTIEVLDGQGEHFATILVLNKGVPALKTLKGAGVYRLVIPEPEGKWQVRILQKMTVKEEWNFRQAIKESPPALKKISVLSGKDGLENFTFSIPEGINWKLVCIGDAVEGGKLKLRVARLGTTCKDIYFYETDGEINCEQWFLKSGDFELTVDAENIAWTAEVQSE